ncbi:MAG: transcription elongation factor GreB [Ottowia sp.]|nr:transcription elongation factor GreB [Ottowia sp.]
MNKAFTRESDHDDDDDDALIENRAVLPPGVKNYITPAGHQHIKEELLHLIDVQRPEVVKIVSWAAANGDRSENGDYIYGKKRLREIDKRIRFLTKRLELCEVVDPAARVGEEQIFFGATVDYVNVQGNHLSITIVGVDEIDVSLNRVSWRAPIAQALLKARAGDQVTLRTPAGIEVIYVENVRYQALE